MPKQITNDDHVYDTAAKHVELLECGRTEIKSKEQLETYPIGSAISYVNSDCQFKQGGFVIKFADEWFAYITPKFDCKVRVRYANTIKIWVGDVYKTRNDIVNIFPTQMKKTKFPVTIGNIPVYYGRKSYYSQRFTTSIKYKQMADWYNYFQLSYLCARLSCAVSNLHRLGDPEMITRFKTRLCTDLDAPKPTDSGSACIDSFIGLISFDGEEIRNNKHTPNCFCSSINSRCKQIIKEYCDWANTRQLPKMSDYEGLNKLNEINKINETNKLNELNKPNKLNESPGA